jgi:hypothetical protein
MRQTHPHRILCHTINRIICVDTQLVNAVALAILHTLSLHYIGIIGAFMCMYVIRYDIFPIINIMLSSIAMTCAISTSAPPLPYRMTYNAMQYDVQQNIIW